MTIIRPHFSKKNLFFLALVVLCCQAALRGGRRIQEQNEPIVDCPEPVYFEALTIIEVKVCEEMLFILDASGSEQIAKGFINSYNSVANQTCDPFRRSLTNATVQQVSTVDPYRGIVTMELQVFGTCQGGCQDANITLYDLFPLTLEQASRAPSITPSSISSMIMRGQESETSSPASSPVAIPSHVQTSSMSFPPLSLSTSYSGPKLWRQGTTASSTTGGIQELDSSSQPHSIQYMQENCTCTPDDLSLVHLPETDVIDSFRAWVELSSLPCIETVGNCQPPESFETILLIPIETADVYDLTQEDLKNIEDAFLYVVRKKDPAVCDPEHTSVFSAAATVAPDDLDPSDYDSIMQFNPLWTSEATSAPSSMESTTESPTSPPAWTGQNTESPEPPPVWMGSETEQPISPPVWTGSETLSPMSPPVWIESETEAPISPPVWFGSETEAPVSPPVWTEPETNSPTSPPVWTGPNTEPPTAPPVRQQTPTEKPSSVPFWTPYPEPDDGRERYLQKDPTAVPNWTPFPTQDAPVWTPYPESIGGAPFWTPYPEPNNDPPESIGGAPFWTPYPEPNNDPSEIPTQTPTKDAPIWTQFPTQWAPVITSDPGPNNDSSEIPTHGSLQYVLLFVSGLCNECTKNDQIFDETLDVNNDLKVEDKDGIRKLQQGDWLFEEQTEATSAPTFPPTATPPSPIPTAAATTSAPTFPPTSAPSPLIITKVDSPSIAILLDGSQETLSGCFCPINSTVELITLPLIQTRMQVYLNGKGYKISNITELPSPSKTLEPSINTGTPVPSVETTSTQSRTRAPVLPGFTPMPTTSPSDIPGVSSPPSVFGVFEATNAPTGGPRITTDLVAVVCGDVNESRCISREGSSEIISDVIEKHAVRCCSDFELDWFILNPGCNVWGGSGVGTQAKCYGSETFYSAEYLCFQSFSRLCTADEIRAGCTVGSGCELENELVWTNTVVPGPFSSGYWTVLGNGSVASLELQVQFSVHKINCCSDLPISGWIQNPKCSVFSKSSLPDCLSGSFEEATSICSSAGGRLCTKDEIQNGCATSDECGYNNQFLWSSTTGYQQE